MKRASTGDTVHAAATPELEALGQARERFTAAVEDMTKTLATLPAERATVMADVAASALQLALERDRSSHASLGDGSPSAHVAELIRLLRDDLQKALKEEPIDSAKTARLLTEIARLSHDPHYSGWAGLDCRDRSTWPADFLKHVDPEVAQYDMDSADELWHYRQNTLMQLLADRMPGLFLFASAAIKYLEDEAPRDSASSKILDELRGCQLDLEYETAKHCLDLVPVVLEVMPFETGDELLAAVRAKLAAIKAEEATQADDDEDEDDDGTGEAPGEAGPDAATVSQPVGGVS